jgi:hypothetical protein
MTFEDSPPASEISEKPPFHDDQEEDGAWIPLRSEGSERVPGASSHTTIKKTSPKDPSSGTPGRGSERLMQLQKRLETRTNLKRNLIDHPIDLFWKRYLINLGRELWELETHVRLGLSMVFVGLVLRVFLLSTWYIWYPRIAFLAAVLVVSLIVMDPFGIKDEFKRVWSIIFSPDRAVQAIEQLEMKQLRRLSLCLFMIPTLLEMRTLSFLAQTTGGSGSVIINFLLASILFSVMMYLLRVKREKPKECIYKGMIVLYGYALARTLITVDLRRAPHLGAPFLTATGTLLLTYRDDDMEWISRVLRQALRLTLRDVLSSMGDKVTQDEMLQLAVLRWIADYWASMPESSTKTPAAESSSNSVSPTESTASSTQTTPSPNQTTSDPSQTPPTPDETTLPTLGRQMSRRSPRFRTHEVQWNELLPMLDVATERMSLEARTIHSNPTSSNPNSDSAGSTRSASGSFGQSSPNSDDPFAGLREMLMSLDVDERGKSAVMAYRRAVESFPPNRRTAFTISVMRKTPALLTLVFHLLFARYHLFTVTLFMVPFIVLEYFRVLAWEMCCQEMASAYTHSTGPESDEPSLVSSMVGNASSMVILLCGDTSSVVRPPKLFLVWRNIQSSVSALEVGLTAARCAQTSIVAAEFAGNIVSLAQLGLEVHQYGLWHGVAVITKEFIAMHIYGNSHPSYGDVTKYTKAAVGAVENAKVVSRNVEKLAEDDSLDPMLRPLVWTLCTLTGHGWLWGNDQPTNEEEQTNDPSTDSDPTSDLPTDDDADSPVRPKESKPPKETAEEESDQVKRTEQYIPIQESGQANELSEVMGMVATAYEQGLIDEVSEIKAAVAGILRCFLKLQLRQFSNRVKRMISVKNYRSYRRMRLTTLQLSKE